jgi:hypothetical protein
MTTKYNSCLECEKVHIMTRRDPSACYCAAHEVIDWIKEILVNEIQNGDGMRVNQQAFAAAERICLREQTDLSGFLTPADLASQALRDIRPLLTNEQLESAGFITRERS